MTAIPFKILLVDDEPKIRMAFRAALETEGCEVLEAETGANALDLLKRNAFDLAILDLRMPEMDGLTLLRKMREIDLATTVIIATAYGDVPNAVEAMRYGAIDFLAKPILPEDLRKVVKEIQERHHPALRHTPRTEFDSQLQTAKRLLNLREFAGAKEHLVKAISLHDRSPDALNLAGALLEMQEDYTRAEGYYQRAIETDKNFKPAQGNLRRILNHLGFGRRGAEREKAGQSSNQRQ